MGLQKLITTNDNPARIITSGCNTAVESLSIFVEKVLYDIASNLPSRIKYTGHMLDIIDEINNSNLGTNSILVGFDIANMFPSIDNKSELKSVHDILEIRDRKFPPTSCIIEALELCLSFNNSIFNNTNYLQTDGTAQGPHMSCSYADLALASYDSKALAFDLSPTTWKRFRDDVFVVWTHGPASVSLFLEYLNKIDKTGKIQFTMQAAGDDGLEFLDLKLKMVNGKISVAVFQNQLTASHMFCHLPAILTETLKMYLKTLL